MTANEFVEKIRADQPELDLSANPDGTAVGIWDADSSEYVPAFALMITGGWAKYPASLRVGKSNPYLNWEKS